MELHWKKEMTPEGNWNPQEEKSIEIVNLLVNMKD